MTEEQRILNSMAGEKSFTISELAKRIDAKENTVRTVIQRHLGWFDVGCKVATSKRGGQPNRFEMKPEKVKAVREQAHADLNRAQRSIESLMSESPEISRPMRWCEDALARRISEAKGNGERDAILSMGRKTLEQARAELNKSMDAAPPAIVAKLDAIDSLIELAELETSHRRRSRVPLRYHFASINFVDHSADESPAADHALIEISAKLEVLKRVAERLPALSASAQATVAARLSSQYLSIHSDLSVLRHSIVAAEPVYVKPNFSIVSDIYRGQHATPSHAVVLFEKSAKEWTNDAIRTGTIEAEPVCDEVLIHEMYQFRSTELAGYGVVKQPTFLATKIG